MKKEQLNVFETQRFLTVKGIKSLSFALFIYYLPCVTFGQAVQNALINDKGSKNHLELNFSILTSKTNFNDNVKKESSSYFRTLAQKEPLSQIYLGTGYGIKYSREIGSNMMIGIGLNFRRYGQQSKSYFGIIDRNVSKMIIVLSTYEIPIILKYNLLQHDKICVTLNAEPIVNIYHASVAKDFRYVAILKKDYGCCEEKYFQATGSILKELNAHIDRGLWRIGISVGPGFHYFLSRNLFFVVSPSLNFYTGFFKKEISSHLADDWIFSFNTDIGFGYNF